MAALPIPMPLRNEETAPTFDTSQPRELPRYFEDLEELMDRAQIASETDKKKQAVRYVSFDTEQLWKAIPEFKNPSISYQEFKQAILVHYPDATDDFIYSIRDLDLLISERHRLGISSAKDLSDYHLHFMAITTWLIDRQQLDDIERRRAYIQAFRPQFLTAIMNRLQLKYPDHHPNIPYRVPEVYAAAQFILQGNSTSLGFTSTATSLPPSIAPANIPPVANLAPFMADLTKNIVDALQGPTTAARSRQFYEDKERHHQIPRQATVTTFVQAVDHTYDDIDERIAALKAELSSLTSKQPTANIPISPPIDPEQPYQHAQHTTNAPLVDSFIFETNYSNVDNFSNDAKYIAYTNSTSKYDKSTTDSDEFSIEISDDKADVTDFPATNILLPIIDNLPMASSTTENSQIHPKHSGDNANYSDSPATIPTTIPQYHIISHRFPTTQINPTVNISNLQQISPLADFIQPSHLFTAKLKLSTSIEPSAMIQEANTTLATDPSPIPSDKNFASNLYRTPIDILTTTSKKILLSTSPALDNATTNYSDQNKVQIASNDRLKSISDEFSITSSFAHYSGYISSPAHIKTKNIIDKIPLPPYDDRLPQGWVNRRPIPVP